MKKVLAKNDHLRVVIMSATVDSEKVRACLLDIGVRLLLLTPRAAVLRVLHFRFHHGLHH